MPNSGDDSTSGIMRTIGRVYNRDATNRQDANNPRETDTIQNELKDDGQPNSQHNGSTKVEISRHPRGEYILETMVSGQVVLYRFDRPENYLDPGATTQNNQIYSTADAAIRGMQSANDRMWRRNAPTPKQQQNSGMRRTFQVKP